MVSSNFSKPTLKTKKQTNKTTWAELPSFWEKLKFIQFFRAPF